ncbi:MAG: hypothetical protein ABIG31_04805 [Candidatus Omnitrophota bacterium]
MSDLKKYGFKDGIPKPYQIEDLNTVLQKVIVDMSLGRYEPKECGL